MKKFIRTYLKTLLFFAMVGLIGGFFVGLYMLDSYPEEIKEQLIIEIEKVGLEQIPCEILIGIATAFQSAGYGLILGGFGIVLGKKTGLWKDERKIIKESIIPTIIISIVGGLLMILPDILFFNNYSDALINSYSKKPTVAYLLATITYAAVIEEVMLRLFLMSLIAFVIHRVFSKNKDLPTSGVLIASNIISALIFALGHLPATFIIIGNTPLIILRCFLLNSGLGLLFGYLYQKHGLRYAMIAHGGCHLVSKLIWILFI